MRAYRVVFSTLLVAGAAAAVAACSASNVTTGVRFDGVTVTCTPSGEDDVSTCTPEPDDGGCVDNGAAAVLWPPNHKLVRFTLADCAPIQPGCGDDGGDGGGDGSGSGSGDGGVILFSATVPPDAVITSITSDEPVEVGAGGDGHTTDYDVAIIDDVTFDLRSERAGGGDGRVYHVNYVGSDGATGACDFVVPHDQGPAHGAPDSGVAVTVTR